jgi:hypothetical protein
VVQALIESLQGQNTLGKVTLVTGSLQDVVKSGPVFLEDLGDGGLDIFRLNPAEARQMCAVEKGVGHRGPLHEKKSSYHRPRAWLKLANP